MLIARHIGKSKAHALLEALSKKTVAEQRHLLDVTLEAVLADPHLRSHVNEAELRAVFDAVAAARRASAIASPQLVALAAVHHAHAETDPTS